MRSKSGNLLSKGSFGKNSKYLGNCPYFVKTGTCSRGSSCRYAKHDKDHVAICKYFLQGSCSRPNCTLSHTPSEFNSPTCTYFLADKCSVDNCKFLHVKPKVDEICPSFTQSGSCEKGGSCEYLHSFECPDFYKSGHCERPGCRLRHKERSSNGDLGLPTKYDDSTVNTLELANNIFAEEAESDSDSEECPSSNESSAEELNDEDEGGPKEQEDLNNDFIKI